ncbi:E4 protein, partial [Omikronpapillomavirus 1]
LIVHLYLAPAPLPLWTPPWTHPWETPYYRRVLDGINKPQRPRGDVEGRESLTQQSPTAYASVPPHRPHHHQSQHQSHHHHHHHHLQRPLSPQAAAEEASTPQGPPTPAVAQETVIPVEDPVTVTVTIGVPNGPELVLTFQLS